MKTDIIVSGVGGQGILLLSILISRTAMSEGFFVKQSFIKGLSQRRGEVFSQIRLSNDHVYSPIILPKSIDLLVGLEQLEAARFIDNLSKTGRAVVSTEKIIIDNYPQLSFPEKTCFIDAKKIAANVGLLRAENMAMLGAASVFLQLKNDSLLSSIRSIVKRSVEENIKAYEAGRREAFQSDCFKN